MRLSPTSLFLVFLGLPSFSFPIYAVTVDALNAATVPVGDKSRAERSQALSQCAREVVLKNSGSLRVYQQPNIQQFIQAPMKSLAKFSYQNLDDKLYLKCEFNLKQVQQTLQSENVPLLGKQRPSTMMWMMASSTQSKTIVNDGSSSVIRAQLQHESDTRGLPLVLPIMDLQDVQSLKVSDIENYFVHVIEQASARYHGDFYAVSHLNAVGALWFYEVRLYSEQQSAFSDSQVVMRDSGRAETPEAAVSMMMEQINAYYVGRFGMAVQHDAASHKVKFSGVQNLSALWRIEQYLNTLSSVNAFKIVGYRDQSVTFDLVLNASMDDFKKTLEIDPKVQVLKASTSYRPLLSEPRLEDLTPSYSMKF